MPRPETGTFSPMLTLGECRGRQELFRAKGRSLRRAGHFKRCDFLADFFNRFLVTAELSL